jgi:tRNA(His) guanylyltransferase
MKDDLGKRMKEQYEVRTRTFLPRRTYTIIRLDGKAFHSFTKSMRRPYDEDLMKAMDNTTLKLCEEIQGSKFAYVQSDEISILLTDFENINTCAWFDGQVQKMVSVSSSIATANFNKIMLNQYFGISNAPTQKLAYFDSRVYTIPDPTEVENYFIWRQKDAVRNSIQMTAQSLYSHKELMGKSSNEQQEMIFQKGTNWNDMPDGFKRGRLIKQFSFFDSESGSPEPIYLGTNWKIESSFDFVKERGELIDLIPKIK